MSRVLVMLASVYDRADRRVAMRDQACAILNEYGNVPFRQLENVTQVVGIGRGGLWKFHGHPGFQHREYRPSNSH